MRGRKGNGQAGFIITLELVLIFTILGLGLMVGIVAIRNALVKFFLKKQAAAIYVVDSANPQKIIGKAFDLDEHEAPRLQFIDRNVDFGGVTVNRRVILGVRDDRFTTRHRIYYQGSIDCGNADPAARVCIVSNGNELGDNQGVGFVSVEGSDSTGATLTATGRLFEAGGIGYVYPMQGGPSYGIGRDIDDASGLPGTLYRETDQDCTSDIRSVWTSQRVVSGGACEPLPAGVEITAQNCQSGDFGAALGDPCDPTPPKSDPLCVTAFTCSNMGGKGCATDAECGGVPGACQGPPNPNLRCACPGTADGDPSNDWTAFGSNCCPPGSTQGATPGQCVISTAGVFKVAEPVVTDPTPPATPINVLSIYEPPFVISYPTEVDATFSVTPPANGEDGPP